MGAPRPETPLPTSKWAAAKDRLGIALVVVSLLLLLFFVVDGSIVNMRCSFWQFVTFDCNRWDARWKPWD